MQSRMDKYNTNDSPIRSRMQKNKGLYEDVKKSDIAEFNVNSNVSIIEENASSIDVNKLSMMLDEKYLNKAPKRKSIEVPEEPLFDYDEPLINTKEYDINSILQKKKEEKLVDYNKERLKQPRVAQYEILSNLDLELKRVEESKNNSKKKDEEENLMNLINTITQLELKNKEEMKNEVSQSLSLLNDLSEIEEEVNEDDKTLPQSEIPENYTKEMQAQEQTSKFEIGEPLEDASSIIPKEDDVIVVDDRDSHIEQTLSKLDIKLSGYEDFQDISKRDTGALIIKIIIFLVIVGLVVGGLFILNNVLDLGLFNK